MELKEAVMIGTSLVFGGVIHYVYTRIKTAHDRKRSTSKGGPDKPTPPIRPA